ncbi:MAG TPA: hypothetical protein VLM40_08165 [Gemmata sp.]|nr:hypothetical protein [Gemmata sp.]
MFRLLLAMTFVLVGALGTHADDLPLQKWDAYRNRLLPDPLPTVKQKFGYSPTSHAGGKAGEIGGWVQRSVSPAYYAMKIAERDLNHKLTAAGTFAVTRADNSSGSLFGWFNSKNRGWRTANALSLRVDGNGGKYWVLFEYGTKSLFAGGKGCFEGEAYQRTPTKPFPADGKPHKWELTYDPNANRGDGEITFTLDGKKYTLPIAPGHKADGATLDRFGMYNHQTSGKGMDIFHSDLTLDGKKIDLSADPQWEGRDNDGTFINRFKRPQHDFGFSLTRLCGQKEPGEIGGVVWRDIAPAYYAAPVGPLTLDMALEASGKIVMKVAASDSGMTFGWFNAKSLLEGEKGKYHPANRLAIMIEGPSRVGHYFRPDYATAHGERVIKAQGPRIEPGEKVHSWMLKYDPKAADGIGRITFRLDDEEQTLDLKPEHRRAGATFDHFGIFVREIGDGNYVEAYLADLKFTTTPPK